MIRHEYGFIFWLHVAIIACVYASPWLMSWRWVAFFAGIYYLQILVVGDCVLTRLQFATRTRSNTFYYYYLAKIWPEINRERVRIAVDYWVPPTVIALAFILQEYYGVNPAWF